jgi:hypothetical protein
MDDRETRKNLENAYTLTKGMKDAIVLDRIAGKIDDFVDKIPEAVESKSVLEAAQNIMYSRGKVDALCEVLQELSAEDAYTVGILAVKIKAAHKELGKAFETFVQEVSEFIPADKVDLHKEAEEILSDLLEFASPNPPGTVTKNGTPSVPSPGRQ